MPLHPESAAYLTMVDEWRAENGYGTFDRMGAERSREILRAAILARRPPLAEMASVEDRTIPARSGPRPARIFAPHRTGAAPLPVALYFYGGGYVIGGIDETEHEARTIAARTPAVVVSASYRMGPEHPFPAAVDDGWDALCWVAENTAALGGDPARLMVGGTSAGGGLAAAVCRLAAERGGPPVALAYLLCPWLDLVLDRPSVAEFGAGYGLDRGELDWFAGCYLGAEGRADDPLVSPARHPAPAGLPPTFILAAECDPLRDDALAYADRLRAAGVPVDLHHAPGMLHAFNVNTHLIPAGKAHLEPLQAALRRVAG